MALIDATHIVKIRIMVPIPGIPNLVVPWLRKPQDHCAI